MGQNVSFDAYGYVNATFTKATNKDAAKYQPYLGWRPLEVVRQTLENTTQMARTHQRENMRGHTQALFPFLNCVQLHETVSTDTFFSSTRDISGATCAQVFYGLTSHFINVYGLRTESDNINALEDFTREEGIPLIICSDNAHSEQLSKSWLK